MSVTIKNRIGGQIIECSAPALLEAIAQGYHFYGLRCRSCGGEFACGQRRDGGELFPKGPWSRRGEGNDSQEEGDRRA